MIYVIDNYDSFTYNIVQILLKNKLPVKVFKNDERDLSFYIQHKNEISSFLISPGPGHPSQSGVCVDILKEFHSEKPILGVCLGHQIIAEFFGAQVEPASQIMHGKISHIFHTNEGIYKGVSNPFRATRYHSLIVEKSSLPFELQMTSWTQDSQSKRLEVMGVRHASLPIEGFQFHPESLMTPEGERLILHFFASI